MRIIFALYEAGKAAWLDPHFMYKSKRVSADASDRTVKDNFPSGAVFGFVSERLGNALMFKRNVRLN